MASRSPLMLWVPCVLYYAFITCLSSIPGTQFADFPWPFVHFDKLVHFGLYLFLGLLLARALRWEEFLRHIKKRWFVYFSMVIPLAVLADEGHQYFVPSRTSSLADWVAGVAGAFCGGYFYVLFKHRHEKKAKGW